MPPVVADYIGGIVRTLLAAALGYLVQHGLVSADATTQMVTWLTGVILVILWSVWQKYGAKQLQLTAQTMPTGATEAEVRKKVIAGDGVPSVLTAVAAVPVPVIKP